MTDTRLMTRLELVRLIGDVITEIDVLRSSFDREDKNRERLDTIRDELDRAQRKLVRGVIGENTNQFKELGTSLSAVDRKLQQTIDDVDKTAQTLEMLVEFVAIAQKIAELAP
ncbi:MAG: hypothetical protein L0Y39_05805 [Methylococcaceae bacterium]|nr:hypothetical protein [Methylococcaceae bacterium]MCI0667413.1 hypothetical protein [Methylococcaceae bacterium]